MPRASTNRAQVELDAIRRDPVRFVERTFGEDVVGKQREILKALATPGITEVHARSCHASGKTHTCARALAWWLVAYPGDSIVVTTAPTWAQVTDQLWREVRDGFQRSRIDLGGRRLTTTWELGPKWYATGIATSPNTAVNLQGYHASHVLVIVDEADGVAQTIWDAIDGLTTSAHVVVLAIGNPINPSSPWRQRVRAREGSAAARVIRISAEDVLPHSADRPYLLQRPWVEDKRHRWGESSAMYTAKVLAEWPEQGADVLIPLAWIERAKGRSVERGPRGLGVDVARFGSARTVRTLIEGGQVLWSRATTKEDTMATAVRVSLDIDQHAPLGVCVDDTGVGGGVVDRLRQLGKTITPVNFGGQAMDHERFVNRGSEIWHWLRDGFERDVFGLDMSDPETMDALAVQLNRARYELVGGRIRVDKHGLGPGHSERRLTDEQRSALSPDHADSLALAWAAIHAYMPKGIVTPPQSDLERSIARDLARAARDVQDGWTY